jgi:AcrR family transcriptional regulator
MSSDQRTLRADARRNRERILSSARELFARQGPQAQMDEIAAQAGLGIGTLYRHFPTKDALLTAMVRDRFQEVAEMATLAAETADPLQALTTIMVRSAELVQDDSGFQLAMMGPDKLEWDGINEQMAAQADTITRVIARAVEAGVVRDDFSYNDYLMIMCGITATMYYKPGNADWRRYLDLVLDGLFKRRPDFDCQPSS